MIKAFKILSDQIKYLPLILRMVKYGDQSTYQNLFLGQIWKIVDPILQVSVYFFIFGLGLRGLQPGQTVWGYLAWLMIGMGIWRFMSTGILSGSESIKKQIGLVTKMRFPLSILPSISIASAGWIFVTLEGIAIIFILLNGGNFSPYWYGSFYFIFAAIVFSYSFALLNSSILILIPDYISILRLVMSVGMWVSGVIFDLDQMQSGIGNILRLSPFYYLVYGLRETVYQPTPFFGRHFINSTIIFWSIVILFLVTGSYFHEKFKKNFVEYL